MIGQIINYRYEIQEKIGDGSLFSVYKSRDKVLNRLVALKVLDRNLSIDSELSQIVRDGYKQASSLTHPNIARIYDTEYVNNICYVACEYARGITVKDRIKRAGPMGVSLTLDTIIPVLQALEYAHGRGMVHGDIRPQDIVVSPDGEVKLTDFGLSVALTRQSGKLDEHLKKSIPYQAPEIAEEQSPSEASDIYSIGIILYEMLTGFVPFDGHNAIAVTVKKIKEKPKAPNSINAGIPRQLSDLIMKAIEPSADDRYTSVSAMLLELKALRDALRTGRSTASVKRASESREVVAESSSSSFEDSFRSRFIWLILLFIVVVLSTLGLTLYFSTRNSQITVPDMLGMTWEEAYEEAQKNNIKLIDNGRMYSDRYDMDRICSVVPPAGTLIPKDKAEVRVKISLGPSRKPVPDLVGLPENTATIQAMDEGFAIGKKTEQYSDTIPVNAVISQKPSAGDLRAPGTNIDIVLSLGPKPQGITETAPSDSEETIRPVEVPNRTFKVPVEVPADAEGKQDVRIDLFDDDGERTVYEKKHNPGEKFDVNINTKGSSVSIKLYIEERLVYEEVN
ncbi:MAG: protein kinase [Armatimonadota bacterium]